MKVSKQFSPIPERSERRGDTLLRVHIATSTLAQTGEVADTVVQHGIMLQVAPDLFDGLQFRAASQQMLQGHTPNQAFNVFFDQPRVMRLQAVPNDQTL